MAKRGDKVTKDFSEIVQGLTGETKESGLLSKIIEIGIQKIMEAEREG